VKKHPRRVKEQQLAESVEQLEEKIRKVPTSFTNSATEKMGAILMSWRLA
jgi:hypothetical protein